VLEGFGIFMACASSESKLDLEIIYRWPPNTDKNAIRRRQCSGLCGNESKETTPKKDVGRMTCTAGTSQHHTMKLMTLILNYLCNQ